MTALYSTRQPFADLDSSRLQSLQSAKNRQNSISAALSSSSKPSLSSPVKRRVSSELFDDDYDSENIDPVAFNSPNKRAKAYDGTPKKAARFVLTPTSHSARLSSILPSTQSPTTSTAAAQRHNVSLPTSSTTTPISPISARGGSPKHKRVGLLSKRRTSSSPFTRVDPPFFSRSNASNLPFSLDAALSGTISSYAPKATSEVRSSTLDDSMPKSWFFEIHEDTPEEEATNLMEHSACTLDISSDDDSETKLRNDAKERGKENIPPSDYFSNGTLSRQSDEIAQDGKDDPAVSITSVHTSKLRKKLDAEAMVEDRTPLSDLPTADYCVTEGETGKSDERGPTASPLSQELKTFDFEMPLRKQDAELSAPTEQKDILVWQDTEGQSSKALLSCIT